MVRLNDTPISSDIDQEGRIALFKNACDSGKPYEVTFNTIGHDIVCRMGWARDPSFPGPVRYWTCQRCNEYFCHVCYKGLITGQHALLYVFLTSPQKYLQFRMDQKYDESTFDKIELSERLTQCLKKQFGKGSDATAFQKFKDRIDTLRKQHRLMKEEEKKSLLITYAKAYQSFN